MVEKPQGADPAKSADGATATATATPTPPRRPGHRGADVRDTVAEMAARAQEISLEAGSKIAAAMKDVIGAAAGITGFAIESARDIINYMVRRGQMTQDEADKLLREVEEAQGGKRSAAPPPRPTTPRASDVVRAPEPVRSEPARTDPSPRTDGDGKKHAAAAAPATPSRPASRAAAKPAAKASRPPAAKKPSRSASSRGKKTTAKAGKKKR